MPHADHVTLLTGPNQIYLCRDTSGPQHFRTTFQRDGQAEGEGCWDRLLNQRPGYVRTMCCAIFNKETK